MLTWILVGDAAEGRIFKTPGPVDKMVLVHDFEHPESRNKGRELISDRPGSAGGNAGVHGGVGERSDPKAVEAEHFAQEMASFLNKSYGESAFSKLVLVLPPHFLGRVRDHLNTTTRKAITETVDKNFARLKEHELKKSLQRYLR